MLPPAPTSPARRYIFATQSHFFRRRRARSQRVRYRLLSRNYITGQGRSVSIAANFDDDDAVDVWARRDGHFRLATTHIIYTIDK